MRVEPLDTSHVGELEDLFRQVSLEMPGDNVRQFCLPRDEGQGLKVGALGLRDGDRLVGTIGYLDAPVRLTGTPGMASARWPINIYLLAEYRGRGWGVRLMEATRDGSSLRLVIGGNAASIPVLEKTGWRLVGHLRSYRWSSPCLDPRRMPDRLARRSRREPRQEVRLRHRGEVVTASLASRMGGDLPWAAGAANENGVVRDANYLAFAFFGALGAYHRLYKVKAGGALCGYFVLAARADRLPVLSVEIVDLDAVAGREAHVVKAARSTALGCADVARLRLSGARFLRALAELGFGEGRPDHPFRVSSGPGAGGLDAQDSWRLTYGDHDQYRVRATSQVWGRL